MAKRPNFTFQQSPPVSKDLNQKNPSRFRPYPPLNHKKLCRSCLTNIQLHNMKKVVVLKDKSEVSILEMYNFCTKATVTDNNYTNICYACLEAFKYIYTFLKKCEKTLQILNQSISVVAPIIESSHVTVKNENIEKNAESDRQPEIVMDTASETIKHPHLCFVCGQSFSDYQALYKHNKVHRPMRCGGQECEFCRKKFFSEDTLKKHQDICGSLENIFKTDVNFENLHSNYMSGMGKNGPEKYGSTENSGLDAAESIAIKSEAIALDIEEPYATEFVGFAPTQSLDATTAQLQPKAEQYAEDSETVFVQFKTEVEDYV